MEWDAKWAFGGEAREVRFSVPRGLICASFYEYSVGNLLRLFEVVESGTVSVWSEITDGDGVVVIVVVVVLLN